MFRRKQLYCILYMGILLCCFTGCSKVTQQESPAETNITSPIPATEIACTPSSMAAEGNSATPIPQWLRINEQSLELDSEADSESKTFLRGFWYDRSDQGDYEFHMEKVKRKSETEEIVKSVAGNYAELHYDKKTKCLTIRGTGEMFYDDYDLSDSEQEDVYSEGWDYSERWPAVWLPIDRDEVKEIVVESGIREVSRFAFGNFSKLEKISLSNTITKIQAFAFDNCYKLEEIVIPDSVESIGNECLSDCYSLKTLKIGKNLKSIGKGNFLQCNSLKNIEVAEENKCFTVQDGILYGIKDKKAYLGCSDRKNVIIRNGTKIIGNFAFSGNQMETLTIPASVESVQGGAVVYCPKLKKINFEKNSKCKKLGLYKIPLFETVWTVYAIENCPKLKKIVLPDSLERLRDGFYGCDSLKKIYIGKALRGDPKEKPFKELRWLKNRYYIVSPENPWYSSRNGKLYNKAGTKLLDDPAAKKKKKSN